MASDETGACCQAGAKLDALAAEVSKLGEQTAYLFVALERALCKLGVPVIPEGEPAPEAQRADLHLVQDGEARAS